MFDGVLFCLGDKLSCLAPSCSPLVSRHRPRLLVDGWWCRYEATFATNVASCCSCYKSTFAVVPTPASSIFDQIRSLDLGAGDYGAQACVNALLKFANTCP
eukprot:746683-Hanusia_phi.AAC.1